MSARKAWGSRSPAGLWTAGEPQMVLLQPEEFHGRKSWPFQEFLRVIPGSAKSSRSYSAKELDRGTVQMCCSRGVGVSSRQSFLYRRQRIGNAVDVLWTVSVKVNPNDTVARPFLKNRIAP